ncbi:inositol monophosphatase family protein [Desulfobacula sp.]|uniref:inositol monophosphatase family protein n=1 Tax=Desulfobacula sp. TaxID=2593537 RepID=UPI002623D01B|nr:inositol monophosphatase family protein [Desulfobacula sp.]
MKLVKIYGERNSGTQFVTRLIRNNFLCEILPGTLADAEPGYRDRIEAKLKSTISDNCKRKLASSIKIDEYFCGNLWKTLGWKHCVPPLEVIGARPDNAQILFVTLTKNPYAWALSMFNRPYDNLCLQKNIDLASFVSEPWLTTERDNCPSILESPIELWNLKTDGYIQLAKSYSVICARYEDVIDDPKKFLSNVSRYIEKKSDEFYILNESAKKSDVGKKDFNYYRDYYLKQRWREQLSDEDIKIINHFLNPSILSQVGYVPIDSKVSDANKKKKNHLTQSKVFGIGLSKTGTTSLARALEMLDYEVIDCIGVAHYAQGDLSSVDLSIINNNNAFTDTPIPSFYRELDIKYPDSKFVLTIRDMDGWLRSCKKQFNEKFASKQNEAHSQLFTDLYGTTVFDEEKFQVGYKRFVNGALEYFKDRPDDLLVIDISKGEGWEKLCSFLGKPTPPIPFPKANVTQITWMNVDDLIAVAKRAGKISLQVYHQKQATGWLAKTLHWIRGGDLLALQRASDTTQKALVEGLKNLNSQIPIISPENDCAPYSERVKWNHVWIVSPLDGAKAFLDGDGEFTINIALIQDGAPLYGVVYVPLKNIVYYARAGQGVFKIEGDDRPQRLGITATLDSKDSHTGQIEQNVLIPQSRALSMCFVAEGRLDSYTVNDFVQEWESAAAHLIATMAGKRVSNCKSNEGIIYNKEKLSTECITVESY